MRANEDTLLDIVLAARSILRFKKGMTRQDFMADEKTQSAIIHKLLIIGEASKRLSEEFKKNYQEVPWQEIARMRDKMIHFYEGVDLEVVWNAVETDIPELLSFLEVLLPSQKGDEATEPSETKGNSLGDK